MLGAKSLPLTTIEFTMILQKSITNLLSAAIAATTMSVGAWAQTTAIQDRAAVGADTRRAATAGTLQPAGEAPDPVGGSAFARHHRHHRHESKHRHAAHHGVRAADQTQEPMTEPKK